MLRLRTMVYVLVCVAALTGGLYLVFEKVFIRSYLELERLDAERNTDRAVNTLRYTIEDLDATCQDWAEFDDTYQFMSDHNPRFLTANIVPQSLKNISVHLIALLDDQGRVVLSRRYTPGFTGEQPLPRKFLSQHLRPDSPLALITRLSPEKGVRGLVNTQDGLMLVAARRILRTDETGPSRGTLVMGRFLAVQTLQDLEEDMELAITVQPLTRHERANRDPLFFRPVAVWNQNYVIGNRVITDIYDQPMARVSVTLARPYVEEARRTLGLLWRGLLGAGAVFVVLTILLVETLVLRRILSIHRRVYAIGKTRDLSMRVPTEGHDELAGLAQQINAMLHALQNAQTELKHVNQELASFSYTVSHDLRAPLRHIGGFTTALLEDHGAELSPKAREYAERTARAAARMGELIEDILTLSRLGRAEMTFEKVDLSTLSRDVLDTLQKASPARRVTVEVQEGLVVNGDRRLLRAMLENLLGNAFKFTAQNPRASITLGQQLQNGEQVFFVRDNGVGFDMQQAGELFQPFRRLPGAEGFEGTGVGLASVRRILERHGGSVRAESSPGEGATFYFTLPLG